MVLTGRWTRRDVDLTAYADQTVLLAFFHNENNSYNVAPGWYVDDISLVTVVPEPLDDFESGHGDWSVSHGVWEIGTPTSGPGSCYTGTSCAGTVLSGNYPSVSDSRLISAPLPLQNVTGEEQLRLRFWEWFNYDGGDYGQVQVSTDNGVSWDNVDSSITYYSGRWTRRDVDLTDYAGQTVLLAFFHYENNSYNVAPGWYVDDISLVTVVPEPLDDFESGHGDWSVSHGVWEIGTPTSGPGSCYTGTSCAGTVLSGNYPSTTDSRLISAPLPLQNVTGEEQLRLRFWEWFNYDGGDYGQVQVSTDNGVSWDNVDSSITYYSGRWTRRDVDLTAYADQTVLLAFFHNENNSYNVAPGWYVDDISLVTVVPEPLDDFESGHGDWSVSHGVWEIGTPTSGPGSCYTGTSCAGTVLTGNYPSVSDSRLISAPLPLQNVTGEEQLRLRFWEWFSYYAGDNGRVQVSTDNGATWDDVGSLISINSSGWTRRDVDLTAYAGQTVLLSFFHYENNAYNIGLGWYIDDISLVTVVPEPLDDFESGHGDWSASHGVWQIGTPTTGPGGCYTGTSCAGTVLTGNYPSVSDSRLISAPLPLPAVTGEEQLRLRFWEWFSYYAGDNGRVQVSTDNGATWDDVGSTVTYYSGGWTRRDVDLTAYAGQTVLLSFFHYENNAYNIGLGWYIDDIEIVSKVPVFTGDFETGWADWTADNANGVWEVGTPTAGP